MHTGAIRTRCAICLTALALLFTPWTLAREEHAPPAATAHEAAGETHAAGEHGAETAPNPFAGDLGNLIYTVLIFVLLIALLGRLAWKPLLKWQHDREDAIRDTLERARKEREEAERVLAEYKRQIDKAREEATAIVDEGRRHADETRQRLQDDSKREAGEILGRARREIQLATETAVKDLYDRTAELAVQVAGNIIHKSLSAEDHRGLVRESLDRMKATNN